MRILVHRDERWVSVERKAFPDEATLEQLIQESPEIIPADPGVDQIVYARQFSCPPGYSIDLVGVGSDGGISVVECKLDKNREAKRQVVGQILEYAAGLSGMTVEDFEERFIDADGRRSGVVGRSPFDLLDDVDPRKASGMAECRARVAENLEAGRFRLMIAVDEISTQLQSIIRYVNAHSGGQLKLVALALPEFSDGTTRVLVPVTFGNEAPANTANRRDVPIPAEEQIANARPEWKLALERMHEALATRLQAEPRPSHIRYVDPASGLALVGVSPGEGNLYGSTSRLDDLEKLRQEAIALGMKVQKYSIKFAPSSPDQLDAFIPRVLELLVSGEPDR